MPIGGAAADVAEVRGCGLAVAGGQGYLGERGAGEGHLAAAVDDGGGAQRLLLRPCRNPTLLIWAVPTAINFANQPTGTLEMVAIPPC